jgi:ATP-dependent Clp protease protease subunit
MSEVEQINPVDTIYEYDLDKEARLVYFYCDVNSTTVAKTIKSLLHLDYMLRDEEHARIGLLINSDGGSLEDSFALYDCIQGLGSEVMTIGTGVVCSAAVLLLACGAERAATENCWVMAHQAEGVAHGNEQTIASTSKLFKLIEKQRYNLLARHTKWTASEWRAREHSKGEVWMSPREMVKAGLIDKVLMPNRALPKKNRRAKK